MSRILDQTVRSLAEAALLAAVVAYDGALKLKLRLTELHHKGLAAYLRSQ